MKRTVAFLGALATIITLSFGQTQQDVDNDSASDSIQQPTENKKGILWEAFAYERGIGRDRDLNKSFELLKEASDTSEYAKYRLAKYYFNGWGTEKDKKLAINIMKSMKESAEYGKGAKYFAKRMRHKNRMRAYYFQFNWIPKLVEVNLRHKETYKTLSDIKDWQIEMGLSCIVRTDWDWSEVSADVLHPTDSTEIVLYHFPYPEMPPLCLFAAAYINHQAHTFGYYTLEKAMDGKHWMLCSVADNYRLNFGAIDGLPSATNFIKRIQKIHDESEEPLIMTRLR